MKSSVIIKFSISLLFFLQLESCKKLIEIDSPKTEIGADKVFSDPATALSLLMDTYGHFQSVSANLTPALSLYSDELDNTSPNIADIEFASSSVTPSNSTNLIIWQELYTIIYQSNDLIEHLPSSSVIEAEKNQLLGEAFFLRAFSYHYLVQLYGDLPLVLTTDVAATSVVTRSAVTAILKQVEDDLTSAAALLPEDYPSGDRVRANKWSVVALQARIALLENNWELAGRLSGDVINSASYSLNSSLDDVFIKDSPETILQFWNQYGYNYEASNFIPEPGQAPTYPLSEKLLTNFTVDDGRKTNWLNYELVDTTVFYYSYKYRNKTDGPQMEYLVALRLGEQYLIHAEAAARLDNKVEAIEFLNTLRARAGLTPVLVPGTAEECLVLISEERRKELFAEWGFRFFDLKRTGQLNEVLLPLKPSWNNNHNVLPVPLYELQSNPALTQSPGY